MTERVKTVEHDHGWGWLARCPKNGEEIIEGFVWRTRDVARAVVAEHVMLGCPHGEEACAKEGK